MAILDFLFKHAGFVEFDFGPRATRGLERNLRQAGLRYSPRAYSGFSLILASAFAALVFLLALSFSGLLSSFSIAALFFSLTLFFMLEYPSMLRKRKAAEVERDLPLLLRAFATGVVLKEPFEKTLSSSCKSYGALGSELSIAMREVQRGVPVPRALEDFSNRVDSTACKRAAVQLAFVYERGFGEEGLRKLAGELVEQQRFKSRVFAAQQSFFGLLFVSASTIVPALFSAYVIVGSSFLSMTFSPRDVIIAFAVVFPAIDFLILYYLRQAKPLVLART